MTTTRRAESLIAWSASALLLLAACSPSAGVSPSPSVVATTPIPPTSPAGSFASLTAAPPPTPRGYILPTSCSYVGASDKLSSGETVWRVLCPQGTLTAALTPSLNSQGWQSCGSSQGTFFFLKAGGTDRIDLRNYVNRSDASGELEQDPGITSCGP